MHDTPKQLSALVHAKFIESVRAGLPIKISAARAGINPNTMNSWLQKGQEDSDEWALMMETALEGQVIPTSALQRLFEGTLKASADFVFEKQAELEKQSQGGSFSATVFMLEKLFPEIYGKKVVTEHTGSIDRNVNITLDVPPEQRNKIIDLMLKKKAEGGLLGSGN